MEVTNKRFGLTILAIVTGLVIASLASPAMAVISSKEYTSNADFDEGTLLGVEHDTVVDQLQLSEKAVTLPFIWVPNSNEGTVSKYDTVTGKELARYRTGPNPNGNPSRTTVDLDGNVWFGNRDTGTVVKIALLENGQWVDKDGDNEADTSRDINDDGVIDSSEILAWGEDECVLYSVELGNSGSGPRGIAIDENNDLWAGTYTLSGGNKFYHIDGDTGEIIEADTIDIGYGSYGALIDGNGNIWSSTLSTCVLKIDTSTNTVQKIDIPATSYGIGIDKDGHVFVAGWGSDIITKIDASTGTIITTASQGDTYCRGVAVTNDGDVWVVNSQNGAVKRLDNNLNSKATISVGSGGFGSQTTGVAVDAEGKVWACNYNDGYLNRIDPSTNTVDFSVQTLGLDGGVGMHYSYSDMTGILARTVTTKIGTWTVEFDSEMADTPWGVVSWSADTPDGTSIKIEVRSSNDGSSWSGWETATNGDSLTSPDGRYLQIKTTMQVSSGDISPVLYDLSIEAEKPANTPPVANAGPDKAYEAGTQVTLDGSGSYDPEGTQLTYSWTWDSGGQATDVSPEVNLPVGKTTTITLTVSDGEFSSTDTVDITVDDTIPPAITTSSEPMVLWPPNSKYHTVSISDLGISVIDVGDPDVGVDDVMITSVSSDELEDANGNGDGKTLNDIVIKGLQTVDLRAEREGTGNGRVYTINYEVKDASGNVQPGSSQVWVPHDMDHPKAEDNGPIYIVNYP